MDHGVTHKKKKVFSFTYLTVAGTCTIIPQRLVEPVAFVRRFVSRDGQPVSAVAHGQPSTVQRQFTPLVDTNTL